EYSLAGRTAEAADRATSAIDLARKHKERANEALALRTLANIIAGSDRSGDEEERHYEAGLALARDIGMRPLIAHCHFGLGKLYSGGRERQRSIEQLATAATMYCDLGMSHWVERRHEFPP